jgi:hypothetical protein
VGRTDAASMERCSSGPNREYSGGLALTRKAAQPAQSGVRLGAFLPPQGARGSAVLWT